MMLRTPHITNKYFDLHSKSYYVVNENVPVTSKNINESSAKQTVNIISDDCIFEKSKLDQISRCH